MEQGEFENDENNNNHIEISPGPNYTKELGELNFTNGKGTDCGFWKYTINSKNYYQCGYYEKSSDDNIFWCAYDRRADHHKEYAGVHAPRTKKLINDGTLDQYLRRTNTYINTRYDIYSKIVHFYSNFKYIS